MYTCVSMCMPGAPGGQQWVTEPLEIELQMVVSHPVAGGNWIGFSGKAASTTHHGAISRYPAFDCSFCPCGGLGSQAGSSENWAHNFVETILCSGDRTKVIKLVQAVCPLNHLAGVFLFFCFCYYFEAESRISCRFLAGLGFTTEQPQLLIVAPSASSWGCRFLA